MIDKCERVLGMGEEKRRKKGSRIGCNIIGWLT